MKVKNWLGLAAVSGILGVGLGIGCLRPWVLAAETQAVDVPALVAGPLRHVPAAQAGRVWEVYVQPGSMVKRGQLLAKVAVPLHSASQQQLEIELRRAEQVQRATAISGHDTTTAALAYQRVAALRQRLAAVPRQLAFVYVQAPATGTVVRLPVATGTYVADSTTLVSLSVAPSLTGGMAQN